MNIRDEAPADYADIADLLTAAFEQPVEADLVAALRRSGDAEIALVAEDDSAIVGHIMLSKLQSPAGCLGLGPVVAAPARQGQGIGGRLIEAALGLARDAGWQAVFLLGDPDYYRRFGFSVTAAAKFETIYPKEYVMALALAPDALETRDGALTYAAPFLALE